jgi:hypothetical protein
MRKRSEKQKAGGAVNMPRDGEKENGENILQIREK